MNSSLISILSLCVAGLAVFVGPIISMSISNKQILSATQTSKKQIISPIRQAWINELRIIISELTARSTHYWASGFEERKDNEYYRITELEHKLRLYLNPKEKDHSELLEKVKIMTNKIGADNFMKDKLFWEAHEAVMVISQQILKREWERVKNDI